VAKAKTKFTRKADDPARAENTFLRSAADLYYHVETNPDSNPEGFMPWSSPLSASPPKPPRPGTKDERTLRALLELATQEGLSREALLDMKFGKLLVKVQKRGCREATRQALGRALVYMSKLPE
jgi:hypothetical protein